MRDLGKRWNERDSCHIGGIYITLSGVAHSDSIVKANWFTAHQVIVKELEFWISGGSTIEANAFNSTALKYVTKLTFPTTSFKISKGIFNGLESLEDLIFDSASLQVIEKGTLDPFSGTLIRFTLKASSSKWSEIYIDGFTGSDEPLTTLTYVKYEYTLKSTLSHKSFVGLQNVIILDLSYCQIETFGDGTFDPIINSVRELYLNNNQIKTLPGDLFGNMLFNDVTSISLDGNKWQCDCDLMPFKMTLMENTNFVESLKCNTPMALRNYDVIDTDFCDDYIPSSTTQRTTTTTQSTTTTTTPQSTATTTTQSTTTSPNTPTDEASTNIPTEPSIPEGLTQVCYEATDTEISKSVFIQAPRSSLRIKEDIYGEVMLEVDKLSENSVFLWFSQFDRVMSYIASDEISCVVARTQSIPITNLKENTAYTFCVMDSTEKAVSPLDCISYTKINAREQPWIRNDYKSLIISMVAFACFISVLIGWAVGFFTLNNIIKKRNQPEGVACINDVLNPKA